MRSLLRSFRFALRGILFCICNERNMRIHLVVAVYVFTLSHFFPLSNVEYAVLIISIVMVIAAEIINTAIEEFVDISSPSFDPLARIAKDTAAGRCSSRQWAQWEWRCASSGSRKAFATSVGILWKIHPCLSSPACLRYWLSYSSLPGPTGCVP